MSEDAGPIRLYQVSMSGWVREQLLALGRTARARGDGVAFAAALQEFYRRLQVYPQFGDPLIDLVQQTGQMRLGVVPPLAMRYGVLEERRLVFVTARPVLMPKAVPGDGGTA